MKAGAADYLNKNTLTPDRLQRSLRYALALHKADEERRLLLEREQHARLQAQAANRAKDEFLATLSHELRTPLNAILGWSRLLASGHLDEPTGRRAIEIIERNTKLQAQLIEDLLDISRIITGKLRLDFRSVSIRSVLEAAADAVRPAAEGKRIRLQLDLPPPEETLRCDPARVQQVVWNLLSNAIKFTPENGSVQLKATRSDGSMVIEVADDGVGIAPAFLPYVFDRFRQQDAATTRAHGGLGLGLSIVQHLVELHGGTVQAQSLGADQGATFLVTLPVAAASSGGPTPEPPPPPTAIDSIPALNGVRVLIVDTDPDSRARAAAILEACGASVTIADGPPAALDAIARQRPDVLLAEMTMPGDAGHALLRNVRSGAQELPPIAAAAMTAFATAGDRARVLLAGYQAHLPKPVDAAELAAVVAALAGRTGA
jgi:signal transduction histidine kinase/CheY-like chemotaxis protein